MHALPGSIDLRGLPRAPPDHLSWHRRRDAYSSESGPIDTARPRSCAHSWHPCVSAALARSAWTSGRAAVTRRIRAPRDCHRATPSPCDYGIQVGAALALAGVIVQIPLRNPLVDPTVPGVLGRAASALPSMQAGPASRPRRVHHHRCWRHPPVQRRVRTLDGAPGTAIRPCRRRLSPQRGFRTTSGRAASRPSK